MLANNLTEAEIRKYAEKLDKMRKRIDKMMEFILKYGIAPTFLYAIDKGDEERKIWAIAYFELSNEETRASFFRR